MSNLSDLYLMFLEMNAVGKLVVCLILFAVVLLGLMIIKRLAGFIILVIALIVGLFSYSLLGLINLWDKFKRRKK